MWTKTGTVIFGIFPLYSLPEADSFKLLHDMFSLGDQNFVSCYWLNCLEGNSLTSQNLSAAWNYCVVHRINRAVVILGNQLHKHLLLMYYVESAVNSLLHRLQLKMEVEWIWWKFVVDFVDNCIWDTLHRPRFLACSHLAPWAGGHNDFQFLILL